MMNETMKRHFVEALSQGVRRDGRGVQDFRDIEIETGVSSTAHGSARVRVGGAEVIAGVKFEVGTPYPDQPGAGSLVVSAELLPMCHRKFEPGPPQINSIEVARVTDRTIRESEAIDMTSLCITEGEKVWMVYVDIMPVCFDGNMVDISVIAAMAALKDAVFPELDKEGRVLYETPSGKKLDIHKIPTSVTVFKYGDVLLLDPTADEEEMYDARLSIGTTDDGKVHSLQKGGETPFTIEEIETMINLAVAKGKDIRKVLKKK